jgi:hypothetical protein
MADEETKEEMDQELSDMFDDVIEAIDDTDEAEVEPEAEVAEEPVDEPEPEPDPEPEAEVETVEEIEETQYVEEPIDEQLAVDGDAGVDIVDDESVGDMAALKAQNEALLKHIEELSGQVIGGVMQPQTAQAAEPKEAPQAQAPAPQVAAGPTNFLGETSIDDLLEDPAKFNAVLNNVAQNAQAGAQQQAVQQVLRSVPELVMGYITRHSAMNRMVDDFYLENTDLVNVKQTVAAVANDVHAKNPELGVEEVFKQSAEATRKLLGLQKQAVSRTKTKPQKPAFAKAGGARKAAPKISSVQSEIDNLLNGDF